MSARVKNCFSRIESREHSIFSGSVLFVGPTRKFGLVVEVGGAEIRNLDFDLGNIQSNIQVGSSCEGCKRVGIEDATRTVGILFIGYLPLEQGQAYMRS